MSETDRILLVIDDEPGIRQGYTDFFEDRLWTVIEADSGEKALDLLTNKSADVAIVDIRMTGMDGVTFIRKAQKSHPELRFVISTGSSGYEMSDDIFSSGKVSKTIIKKPIIDMKIMEDEILNLLGWTKSND